MIAVVILSSASLVVSPASMQRRKPTVPNISTSVEQRVDPALRYAWLSNGQRRAYESLSLRITPPAGYFRVEVPAGSFAHWLRHLPAAPEGTPVTTADRAIVLPADHPNLAVAIALQPHLRRLLCGSNMMLRLRAEYAWATGLTRTVAFHYTSGQLASWRAWSEGVRPVTEGRAVRFKKTGIIDDSRDSFCGYLETLFQYASSLSLLDDTRRVEDGTLAAGDILLHAGCDGHALMILDVATDSRGQVCVMLGEGGMPVQTFHVLRSDGGSPWFAITQSRVVDLGELGVFQLKHLRRWVR